MGRVRIKDSKPSADDSRRLEVWNVLATTKCVVNKVYKAGNNAGYSIVTQDEELEKITSSGVKEAFSSKGFEVVDPPELNANKTIVVTNADPYILSKTDEEIGNELERTKTGVKVKQVIRLPTARTIFKVRLETSQMAKRCAAEGILLFSQSFPQTAVSQDFYVRLDQCMRCYAYDHVKRECPKPETYKICSSCGAEGHLYTSCCNVFVKCIHCKADHPTMAARCPKRKELLREKSKQLRETTKTRATVSYAAAAGTSKQQSQSLPQKATWSQPPDRMATIINTALIKATLAEAAKPGSYQTVLDAIYKANGLTPVIIPKEARLTEEISALLTGKPSKSATAEEDNLSLTLEADTDSESEMVCESRPEKRGRDSDSDTESNQPPPKQNTVAREETEATPAVQTTPKVVKEAATTSNTTTEKRKKVPGLSLYSLHGTAVPKNNRHTAVRKLIAEGKVRLLYSGKKSAEEIDGYIQGDQVDFSAWEILRTVPLNFDKLPTGRVLKKS